MNPQERYLFILNSAMQIRLDRQKQYGDGWINNSDDELINIVDLKLQRLKYLLKENKDKQLIEDNIIDIINYLSFIGAKRLE